MLDVDFEYDGIRLSELGFIICSFNGEGADTVTEGSQITFNQTPVMMGKKHLLAGAKYEECIEAEFDICRTDCRNRDYEISDVQERELMRWLNRREFLKFRTLTDKYDGLYFYGSFNIQKIELGQKLIGMHLTFQASAPFGYTDVIHNFTVAKDGKYIVYDASDEIGYTYLDMTITCKGSGNLSVTNLFDNRITIIRNCIEGEVITLKDMIISSSDPEHNTSIMNDFNFKFPRIVNSFRNRKNTFVFSLPCKVKMKYSPIRKVGV